MRAAASSRFSRRDARMRRSRERFRMTVPSQPIEGTPARVPAHEAMSPGQDRRLRRSCPAVIARGAARTARAEAVHPGFGSMRSLPSPYIDVTDFVSRNRKRGVGTASPETEVRARSFRAGPCVGRVVSPRPVGATALGRSVAHCKFAIKREPSHRPSKRWQQWRRPGFQRATSRNTRVIPAGFEPTTGRSYRCWLCAASPRLDGQTQPVDSDHHRQPTSGKVLGSLRRCLLERVQEGLQIGFCFLDGRPSSLQAHHEEDLAEWGYAPARHNAV